MKLGCHGEFVMHYRVFEVYVMKPYIYICIYTVKIGFWYINSACMQVGKQWHVKRTVGFLKLGECN